jgi:hypothetical protein
MSSEINLQDWQQNFIATDEATCEQINAIAKLVEAARKAREDSK